MNEGSYIENQLARVMTTSGNKVRIKLWGDGGSTHTLEIKPETFDAVERLLIAMEGDQ